MREIKFRGMRASGGFAYGLLSHDLPRSTAYYDEYSYRICWHPDSGGEANVPVKNGTIGQYTGLKDKNGVEIYEGDIVRETFKNEGRGLSVVEHDTCNPRLCLVKLPKEKYNHISPEYDFIACGLRGLEVIGNIYETPDLLEA